VARVPALQDVEAPPEIDRLGEYPHPRHTKALYGHAEAEQIFAEAVAAGRLHHGWLLTGPVGIGKATLAYRVARFLLARSEERRGGGQSLEVLPDSGAARQVAALSHPGLLVIRRQWDHKGKRFGASIAVDDVRRLRSFLTHTPGDTGWRVVIVDPADDLNPNAANAVLKSLEEPPPQTVFLLLSAEPGRLLATIRSRCRTLALQPLGEGDLEQAVRQAMTAAEVPAIEDVRWPMIISAAAGSVRRALAATVAEGLATREKVERIVALLPKVDWQALHTLSDELAVTAAEARYEAFFEELLAALAALVRARAGGGDAARRAVAERVIPDGRVAAFAEAWQRIAADKAACDRLNLDRKALIHNVISLLAEAARPA
jgi:DNA polymerase-3 subunit delta'